MRKTKLYRFLRPMINGFMHMFYHPTIINSSIIPKEGKIILAGNHISIFDPLLLVISTKRTIHFLAKVELTKGPKKIIFNNMGIIPVDRSIKDSGPINDAVLLLNENEIVGIFPEGTTKKNQERLILPFKYGVSKMACSSNASVIPFVITGDYKIFRKKIKIEFLKPIKIDDVIKGTKELEKLISSKIKEAQDGHI